MRPMTKTPTRSALTETGAGRISRRQFVHASALGAAAISFPFVGKVLSANDKINVACIGVKGKGDSDTDDTARCGGDLVALCDVDERHLKDKAQKYPKAKLYNDFRK